MTTQHHVFRPDERPLVDVLVDGVWHFGELRMWSQHADGSWEADVSWRPAGEHSRRIDTFRADEIRALCV